MKKLLGIIVLGLFLCTSTYAAKCNLEIDDVEKNVSSAYTAWTLYNPTNQPLFLSHVMYYRSDQSLIRSYPMQKFVPAKSNINFLHWSSKNLLIVTTYYDIKC